MPGLFPLPIDPRALSPFSLFPNSLRLKEAFAEERGNKALIRPGRGPCALVSSLYTDKGRLMKKTGYDLGCACYVELHGGIILQTL